MNDYKKLLNMLVDNISYIYYKTDGTYGDLHPLVADSVKYVKEQLTPNNIDAKCGYTMKEEAYHNCFAPQPYTDRQLDSDYVDLGLPSGTLWATCNVGANKPEEYGDHFTWGEAMKLDKTLPSLEQTKELLNYCTCVFTTRDGKNGQLLTGPNGKTIFLPAAGGYNDGILYDAGSYGSYWSSSLIDDCPHRVYTFYFGSDYVGWNNYYRYFRMSVRAVKNKEE